MKTEQQPVRIGITCGDINGIGPEIIRKAVEALGSRPDLHLHVIGPEQAVECFGEWQIPFNGTVRPGVLAREASVVAVHAIERAVQGCLDGRLDAMVTAPVCKEGLRLAGSPFPGHTEMIASLTGTRRFGMMLMGRGLRVMLVTRHAALRQVAGLISESAVVEAVELTAETLDWFGIEEGRIAVCGLNPHCGDGGALGDEEARIIAPAIRQVQEEGRRVFGPLPADAVFYEALQGRYDAVVAMYHDQGLGPLKTVAFDCGVNLTVGLPIVRTSPDHGTAFSLAGKDEADPGSLIAAVQTAAQLAGRPNPWKGGSQREC